VEETRKEKFEDILRRITFVKPSGAPVRRASLSQEKRIMERGSP